MVKALVVSLHGQYNHLIWRRLEELGVDAELKPFNMLRPEEVEHYDCIVVGGGPYCIPRDAKVLWNVVRVFREACRPVLGICLGLHVLVYAYEGVVGEALYPEFGRVEIEVVEEDELFKGLPRRFVVWESHNDEVKVLPRGFQLLARSDTCAIQAIKHESKPLYGVQFHPEVEHTMYGREILEMFVSVARR